ncbi:hypothetical protein C9374_001643 [Naegleria lovaniensis]|uniref:5'-nucleotidase n=1 Tax=Naegleria lovaniensis TaxID=51637 RepID=A0AA88KN84_NAELO|nr:uncharacterized protein C9374_001643 [Naegleria lovaniensis]KAG2387311.1 hypothetical protein C9374_001643 [Naegleria lovaniensis]
MPFTPKTPFPSINFPPTSSDFKKIDTLANYELPEKYRRPVEHRIFVNRSVNLDHIEYYGFDMDYTVANYISPVYESTCTKLILQRLVESKGYPSEILQINYDPSFAVRGTFLDKREGNILKVDHFGFVLQCVHGKKIIKKAEFEKMYPDHLIHPDEEMGRRYFCYDTLFGIPEASLYASLVDYFEQTNFLSKSEAGGGSPTTSDEDIESPQNGNEAKLSYWSLFDDIRETFHSIHSDNTLKNTIMADLPKYVKKDERLPLLFHRMRQAGKKIFLLTNSEYFYTNAVMGYLLDKSIDGYDRWTDFFDIVITNGQKPKFFSSEGTTLREVDQATGRLKLSAVQGFKKGSVYCGGSFSLFKKFTKTKGSEVMYVGDNIFHDIIVTKQNRCLWRTLLIVREVEEETKHWMTNRSADIWSQLNTLEYIRAQSFKDQDSSQPVEKTKIKSEDEDEEDGNFPIKYQIKKAQENLNAHFNPYFGSAFRSGTRESYFCTQVQRYADLYCSDMVLLLYYPFNYYFSPIPTLLPHEREALYQFEKSISQ